MAPAQQPAEDLEKEKRPGGLGEEAREPAYCIRCGVGFLVAILLDIDRETHEYSLIRRGCVRRRSPLRLYAHRCTHTRGLYTRAERGRAGRAQEEERSVECRRGSKLARRGGPASSLLQVSPPPVFSPRGRRLS